MINLALTIVVAALFLPIGSYSQLLSQDHCPGGNDGQCLPEFKPFPPELVMLSNAAYDTHLRCDLIHAPRVHIAENWDGCDVWRLVEVGQYGLVMIASWTEPPFFLSTAETIVELTTDESKADHWLVDSLIDGVIIRSMKNRAKSHILSMRGDNVIGLTEYSPAVPRDSLWHLEPPHRNVFYITSKIGKAQIKCHRKNQQQRREQPDNSFALLLNEEEWRFVLDDRSDARHPLTCRIQSAKHDNQYMTVQNEKGGEVVTGDKDHQSLWQIQKVRQGEYKLVEHSSQKVLNNQLEMDDAASDVDQVIWILERRLPLGPRLPTVGSATHLDSPSPKSTRLKLYTTAAVGGVLGAVAAPYLVTSAIAAAGFGATGISAGSWGAAMMSAAAGTGGATAGGMLATLQSIGAAGLSWTGLTAVAGSGAVVGGGIAELAQRVGAAVGSTKETQNE